MRRLSKIIITRIDKTLVSAVSQDGKIVEIQRIEEEKRDSVGNIFIGKIKNIVKNINAAFVDFGEGCMGYLPLEKMEDWIFTLRAREKQVTIGDELVIQVKKSAVKTKEPVLTGDLQFKGKYIVLLHGEENISCSHKIKDENWIKENLSKIREILPKECGAIIRTNAYENELDMVLELSEYLEIYQKISKKAKYKKKGSLLYQMPPAYIEQFLSLKDAQIVTDETKVYEKLVQSGGVQVSFYEDKLLPLRKLHSLETVIERAIRPQVWLKSGGYLVIEPTEALTVIDVNTGKVVSKNKDREETFYKVNLEAAKEVAYQLRLRNLSGIIIVDFIDMKDNEHKKELLKYLEQCMASDSVKSILVDMTKLNLVELTRKRINKPLYEQFVFRNGKVMAHE